MKNLFFLKLFLVALVTMSSPLVFSNSCSGYNEKFCQGEFGRNNNCTWRVEQTGSFQNGVCEKCDPLFTSDYLSNKSWAECVAQVKITDMARCLTNNGHANFIGTYCNNSGDTMQTDEALLVEDRAVSSNADVDMERIELSKKIWAMTIPGVTQQAQNTWDAVLLATSGAFYLPVDADGIDTVSVHTQFQNVVGSVNGVAKSIGVTPEYLQLSTLNTPGTSLGEPNHPNSNLFFFKSTLPSNSPDSTSINQLTKVEFSTANGFVGIEGGKCVFNQTKNYSDCGTGDTVTIDSQVVTRSKHTKIFIDAMAADFIMAEEGINMINLMLREGINLGGNTQTLAESKNTLSLAYNNIKNDIKSAANCTSGCDDTSSPVARLKNRRTFNKSSHLTLSTSEDNRNYAMINQVRAAVILDNSETSRSIPRDVSTYLYNFFQGRYANFDNLPAYAELKNLLEEYTTLSLTDIDILLKKCDENTTRAPNEVCHISNMLMPFSTEEGLLKEQTKFPRLIKMNSPSPFSSAKRESTDKTSSKASFLDSEKYALDDIKDNQDFTGRVVGEVNTTNTKCTKDNPACPTDLECAVRNASCANNSNGLCINQAHFGQTFSDLLGSYIKIGKNQNKKYHIVSSLNCSEPSTPSGGGESTPSSGGESTPSSGGESTPTPPPKTFSFNLEGPSNISDNVTPSISVSTSNYADHSISVFDNASCSNLLFTSDTFSNSANTVTLPALSVDGVYDFHIKVNEIGSTGLCSTEKVTYTLDTVTAGYVRTNARVNFPFESESQDASGNNNHAILSDNASFYNYPSVSSNNIGNHALSLANGHAMVESNSTLRPDNNLAISQWVKFSDPNSSQTIAQLGDSVTGGYRLTINNGSVDAACSDKICLTFINSGSVASVSATSNGLITNQLHHLVATFDGAARSGSIYLDGVEISNFPSGTFNSGGITYTAASNHLCIGQDTTSVGCSGNSLNAEIDQFIILGSSITADQVRFLYHNPNSIDINSENIDLAYNSFDDQTVNLINYCLPGQTETPEGDCETTTCNQALTNGSALSGTYGSGGVSVNCVSGYTPSVSSVNCGVDGNFLEGTVSCLASCSLSAISNSSLTSSTTIAHGTLQSVSCTTGFSGGGSFSCSDGTTSGSASCSDVNECTENTDNCHANATCTNTSGSFSCACDSGYTGNGASCSAVNCSQSLNNGSALNGAYNNGSVNVICNSGYTASISTVTCQANGTFNQTASCNPNSCQSTQVTNSQNHEATGSIQGVTGDNVNVTCVSGSTGGGTTTCGTNGSFSPTISCSDPAPQELADIIGGSIQGSDITNNTTCSELENGEYDCVRNVGIHSYPFTSFDNRAYLGDGTNGTLYTFVAYKAVGGNDSCGPIDASYTIGNSHPGTWNSSANSYNFATGFATNNTTLYGDYSITGIVSATPSTRVCVYQVVSKSQYANTTLLVNALVNNDLTATKVSSVFQSVKTDVNPTPYAPPSSSPSDPLTHPNNLGLYEVRSHGFNNCITKHPAGSSYCWGRNYYSTNNLYPFINSSTREVDWGATETNSNVIMYNTGQNFADIYCWIDTNQDVQCSNNSTVGGKTSGQFNIDPSIGETITSFSKTYNQACATTSKGELYCWGVNTNNIMSAASTLSTVSTPIKLDFSEFVHKVYVGKKHSCVILGTERKVKCWGQNDGTRLGINNSTTPFLYTMSSYVKDENGTDISNVYRVDADHWANVTCAINYETANDTSKLLCWGSAVSSYQAKEKDSGSGANKIYDLKFGSYQYALHKGDQILFTTNINSTFNAKTEIPNVISIGGSYVHMCAISLENNVHKLKCFGSNSYYATGGSSTSDSNTQDTLTFE